MNLAGAGALTAGATCLTLLPGPCLRDGSLRARAVKRLGGIVDSDASIMGREAVQKSVTLSFLDEAVSVRQVRGLRGVLVRVEAWQASPARPGHDVS